MPATPPRPAPPGGNHTPRGTARPRDGSAPRAKPGRGLPLNGLGIPKLIAARSSAWSVDGPNHRFMQLQAPLWNLLEDAYFRLEMSGWERLPAEPSLLIGVHSGGSLTMDAWTLCHHWWRHFGKQRILHGTAHDGLIAAPGLGDYMRLAGTIPAKSEAIEAAFRAGHDVVLWPGGDVDSMRTWRKRDQVVLGGRKGWVRLALRSGVPIVPVATIGGPETVFILSEGKRLAKLLGLKALLRTERLPITLGIPVRDRPRDPADARAAARQDPHRAARPRLPGHRPRTRQRPRLRQRRLPRRRAAYPGRRQRARHPPPPPHLRLTGDRPCRRRGRRGHAG